MPDIASSVRAVTVVRDLSAEPPLCVDLDGTLLKSDLLLESLAAMARTNPWRLLLVPLWLLQGRSHLKAKAAQYAGLDVSNLPYNTELVDWLRQERRFGRQIILATAAAQTLAEAVSDHFGLFDFVIASPAHRNVKGNSKLADIDRLVGSRFDYVGDSAADLPLFAASQRAICVRKAQTAARRRKLGSVSTEYRFYPEKPSFISSIAKELRVHQWAKNLLVFLPLIAAHQLTHAASLLKAFLCFCAFNCIASSVYVVNDIIDIEADRAHEQKRKRPLAAGNLSLGIAFFLAPALFLSGISGALFLSVGCGVVVLTYFGLSLLYTFVIKRLVLYDVFALAMLYTLRLFAGQEAYDVRLSTWLVSCSFFLFQSLAFCKRASELATTEIDENRPLKSRDYRHSDLTIVSCFGIVSGMLASLFTVLYVESDNVKRLYHRPELLWLLCPLVLQWVARTWILAHRGLIREDPVLFSLKDKATWITATTAALVMIAASL